MGNSANLGRSSLLPPGGGRVCSSPTNPSPSICHQQVRLSHRLFLGILQMTPHCNDTLASFKADPQVTTSLQHLNLNICLLGLELQTLLASAVKTLLVSKASFLNGAESDSARTEPARCNIIVLFSSKSVEDQERLHAFVTSCLDYCHCRTLRGRRSVHGHLISTCSPAPSASHVKNRELKSSTRRFNPYVLNPTRSLKASACRGAARVDGRTHSPFRASLNVH